MYSGAEGRRRIVSLTNLLAAQRSKISPVDGEKSAVHVLNFSFLKSVFKGRLSFSPIGEGKTKAYLTFVGKLNSSDASIVTI